MYRRMLKRILGYGFFWFCFVGAVVASDANVAHPRGPEGSAWSERSIMFKGDTRNIRLTLAYPKPDDVVDWAPANVFDTVAVTRREDTALSLAFLYNGYFWQGYFGKVRLAAAIRKRQFGTASWKDIDSFLNQEIRSGIHLSAVSPSDELRESEEVWMQPFISQLNGTPCVQQYVYKGKIPKAITYYSIPFEDNYVLQIELSLLDNSTRPGLPPSDWLPRARVLSDQLISRVKIEVESK